MRKIRFIIDSDLENVAMVGISINRLCSLIPLSEINAYQIELCAVEAINNSIIHSYDAALLHKVEITFGFDNDNIVIKVYDTGKSLDKDIIDKADLSQLENGEDINSISENGRGLALIKEVMDKVDYCTKDGKNCLTMIKLLPITS